MEFLRIKGNYLLSANLLYFMGKLHYHSICKFESDLKACPLWISIENEFRETLEALILHEAITL